MCTAVLFAVAAALLEVSAAAAQETEANWPCPQRKVEHMSLAVMWPMPLPEDEEPLRLELRDIAERMALRRISIEEVGRLVDAMAGSDSDVEADTYARLFAAAFDSMDRQRTMIVQGITRYAQGQADMAEEINELREEFNRVKAQDEPDFDRLDQLEKEIDWRERIFDDRKSSLTYVCESPVLIEKRTYSIAQLLLEHVDR